MGPESGRPSPVMWSRVDRELYPEIEKAIAEAFPGESDRVRLAAVKVWGIIMSRVPASDRIEGMSWCRHFDRATAWSRKTGRPASRSATGAPVVLSPHTGCIG